MLFIRLLISVYFVFMPLKWQRKKEAKKESFARFVFKFVLVSFSRLYILA